MVDITDQVKEGQHVARLTNIFGDVTREYFAPCDGVVVGKSVDPVARTGDRILHLGVPAQAGELMTHSPKGQQVPELLPAAPTSPIETP